MMSNVDEIICLLCRNGNNEETLLLCDGCDVAMHLECINLTVVPKGRWFCPKCRIEEHMEVSDDEWDPYKIVPGMKVALYERVSSSEQDCPEWGRVGMDTQNTALLTFAIENGLVVLGTAREVHSARNPTQLKELLSLMKKHRTKCILVYSVSRFSRNYKDGRELLDKLHSYGGWIYSVTEKVSSHEEKFMELLRAAQHESDQLSKKMKDAYKRIRLAGGHIGPAPFGKSVVRDEQGIRRLTENKEEQKVIGELKKTFEKTGCLEKTAERFNLKGTTRRGKFWTKQQVGKYLNVKIVKKTNKKKNPKKNKSKKMQKRQSIDLAEKLSKMEI